MGNKRKVNNLTAPNRVTLNKIALFKEFLLKIMKKKFPKQNINKKDLQGLNPNTLAIILGKLEPKQQAELCGLCKDINHCVGLISCTNGRTPLVRNIQNTIKNLGGGLVVNANVIKNYLKNHKNMSYEKLISEIFAIAYNLEKEEKRRRI